MPTPADILEQYWGYKQFRPLQADIINSVLQGNDTLALLPTGGGKSICFQVPGMILSGICLVISPLIALMKDQVYHLTRKNISAEAIFSGMNFNETQNILQNCLKDKIKFLYISPERLQSQQFKELIPKLKITLLAIDEAHCISQWGYDFRPSYLQIAQIRALLPSHTPVIALTATATKQVKLDIQEKLQFKNNKKVFEKSFIRPNLSYSVFYEENKLQKLLQAIKGVGGCGIIYVKNRKKTSEISEFLIKNNIKADDYHAGFDPKVRSKKQDKWMKNQTQIMVCTNAFGMGIDKDDVKLVVHLDLPDSLEAYYQEAGRAGRNEKKAYCLLLYNNLDINHLYENLENNFPPIELVKQVYHSLGNYFKVAVGTGLEQSFDFDINDFCKTYQFKPINVYHSIKILQQNNIITANDAVFLPSRLLITANKQTVYNLEVANQRIEPYIKAILRSYGGVFDNYTLIKESEIAKVCKATPQQVVNALQYLKKQQIIDYIPQTDKPQIVFTQSRLLPENIRLDLKLLEFRKKVQSNKINAAINYAKTNSICRSQQLVAYFNDWTSDPCGICDFCLNEKKQINFEKTMPIISDKIKQLLKQQLLTGDMLLKALPNYKPTQISNTLRILLDSNKILINENRFFYWND